MRCFDVLWFCQAYIKVPFGRATFVGAGHFKINNPAASVGRPRPNCYVLAPAAPDRGCKPRASATGDRRPPARHGPRHHGSNTNSWKCEQKHQVFIKHSHAQRCPLIAGRQGTMVPCTGRDGPRTDRIQVALLHARCSTYKGGLDTGHDGALCRRGGRALADLGL